MFKTYLGPVDSMDCFIKKIHGKGLIKKELREKFEEAMVSMAVYVRPETAQVMFVQFLNVQQSSSMKVPFGIAQQDKSFRNEIIVENFIFLSFEFEQMEIDFFVEPGTQKDSIKYWTEERLNWYKSFANAPEKFILRRHDSDELAHYSDECFDVE